MVSLHEGTTLGSTKRREFHSSSKKRREEDEYHHTFLNKRTKSGDTASILFDFELHLRTPLPLELQDTRGQSRTSEEYTTRLGEPARLGGHKMSLDLELNLSPSESPEKNNMKNVQASNQDDPRSAKGDNFTSVNKNNTNTIGLSRCPSWLAFEGDEDGDDDGQKKKKEMVATVCMKCHMLVMLCKSAPVCPNCKFMHPHDHSSTNLFKPSRLLSLLC